MWAAETGFHSLIDERTNLATNIQVSIHIDRYRYVNVYI